MKKNIAIFLIASVIAILLIASFYEFESKKIETSAQIDSTKLIEASGESFSGETKVNENTDSGEIDDSGEKVEVTTGEVQKENIVTKSESPKKLTSNTPYYIKINNLQNVVTIYSKDSEGKYTIPYKAMVCSTGTATPVAGKSYKVTTYKNRWNGLQGNVYGQYATQIVGNILFHSVPYTAKNNASLEYWEYDKLGTAASLGCVRLTVEDAKWIYDNISSGTIVEFYEDENPGPLGKPTAQKISDNEAWRDWDPTDPDIQNPWNGGSGILEEVKTEPQKTNTPKKEEIKPVVEEPINSNAEEVIEEEESGEEKQLEEKVPETYGEEVESQIQEIIDGEKENENSFQEEEEYDDWIGSGR